MKAAQLERLQDNLAPPRPFKSREWLEVLWRKPPARR